MMWEVGNEMERHGRRTNAEEINHPYVKLHSTMQCWLQKFIAHMKNEGCAILTRKADQIFLHNEMMLKKKVNLGNFIKVLKLPLAHCFIQKELLIWLCSQLWALYISGQHFTPLDLAKYGIAFQRRELTKYLSSECSIYVQRGTNLWKNV